MTNEYITRQNVERFLGFTIDASQYEAVDEIISQECDEFDRLVGNSWRVVKVNQEHHEIPLTNNWIQAQKVYLYNRHVKKFSSAAGDKWLVWNGTTWEDWLTTKLENTDYFVEYHRGVIYIRPFVQYPLRTYNILEAIPMRFTYRFGENGGDENDATYNIANVPSDVKRAVIKMVATNLVETNEWHETLPEGTDRVKLEQKVALWRRDIDRTIRNRKEVKTSR